MGACAATQNCSSAESAKIIADTVHTCAPTNRCLVSEEGAKLQKARLLLQEPLADLALNTVEVLDLMGNGGGDSGAVLLATALKGNTSLRHLNLRWSSIGSRGAEALAEALKVNRTVKTLDLYCNSIRDAGASALATALGNNCTMRELDVGWNSIACGGACALADALKRNNSLERLGMERNGVEARGAAAIADALQQNMALTSLQMAGNPLGEEAALALVEATGRSPTSPHLRCDLVPESEREGDTARSALSLSGFSIPEDETLKDDFMPAATADMAAPCGVVN